MILHIQFIDGSNPYFYRADDPAAILKEFKRWQRSGFFPRDNFTIITDHATIEHDYNGVWYIRHNNRAMIYKRLGNALNAVLGGASHCQN